MTTTLHATTGGTTHPIAAAAARPDLYAPIHKALRALMFDTLARIGRIDLEDGGDTTTTLEQAELMLEQLESHLHHENEFVHAAIEARRAGGARATADAHVEHADTIRALRSEIAALRAAPAADQPRLATLLYRHLALFIAENLEHMHYEETANNALLWALYTDEELHGIHDRLVARLDARILSTALPWMAAAMTPAETLGLFSGMQAKMPPEPFLAVLQSVRPRIEPRRFERLASSLGMAA
jgi:hypothetical protein